MYKAILAILMLMAGGLASNHFVVWENPPVPVVKVEPEYPQWIKDKGIEGTVLLDVRVLADSTVAQVEIIQSLMEGPGGLDECAVNAVKQWKFAPSIEDGEAIDVWVQFPIEFKLD